MPKRALIVGIDHYEQSPLNGCVKDANRIAEILERNEDASVNFSVKTLTSDKVRITEGRLNNELEKLFSRGAETALFYFSGHGFENNYGGKLVTQDARHGDEGLNLSYVLQMANTSPLSEVVIILDCCYAQNMGDDKGHTHLDEGVSILAASLKGQVAMEGREGGLFTSLLIEGLKGGAADIMGEITAPSLYNFADKMFSPMEQRPVFKSSVTKLSALRKCEPRIELKKLHKIEGLFETDESYYQLDKRHEKSMPEAQPNQVDNLRLLKKYQTLGLVEAEGFEDLYYAAINDGKCRLTPLGKMYWNLVYKNLI